MYSTGETITLTAYPGINYHVGSWSGTDDDASTSLTNILTMREGDHTAAVNYAPDCFPLTLSHTGNGSDPTAAPANSAGCPLGQYSFRASIQLTATPADGYMVNSWTGTQNDQSNSSTNTVVMSAAPHSASANYIIGVCHELTRTFTGVGSAPTASPAYSPGCFTGYFIVGELITLTAHPAQTYQVATWSGTDDNSSTLLTNYLTMPPISHAVSANYAIACFPLTLTHTGLAPTPPPIRRTQPAVRQPSIPSGLSLFSMPARPPGIVYLSGREPMIIHQHHGVTI